MAMTIADYLEAKGVEKGIEIGERRGIEKSIERGIEKGIEKGIERGIEKGIETGADRTYEAFELLTKGLNVETVAKEVGLSLERVHQLATLV